MWIRLLQARLDNPLFVHARRRLRRTWWRSWFTPALILVGGLYAFLAALQWGPDWGAAPSGLEVTPDGVLRAMLLILLPLMPLMGFVAGARTLQREREHSTLDTLLMTELDNVDLIAGKILGCLMPFAVFFLLLIPAALLFGWKTTDITVPSFGANWRFSAVIEGLWNRPVFETLLECFIGATLGVIYGVHRAAHHPRAVAAYSVGMISFLVFIPFALGIVSLLFVSLVYLLWNGILPLLLDSVPNIAPAAPFLRAVAVVIAAWLLTLIPLFEMADRFRVMCGEEESKHPFRRPRSASPVRPTPWTAERPMAQDRWAEWEERRKAKAHGGRESITVPSARARQGRDYHDS